jgi:hypothetical protein
MREIILNHKNRKGELKTFGIRYLCGHLLFDTEVKGAKSTLEAARYVLLKKDIEQGWDLKFIRKVSREQDLYEDMNEDTEKIVCMKVSDYDKSMIVYDLFIAKLKKR